MSRRELQQWKAKRERPPAAGPPVTPNTQVTHRIALEPEDWLWATWRGLAKKERAAPQPFDLADCLARLARVTPRPHPSLFSWKWEKAEIADTLTRPEAHFWFEAMARVDYRNKPRQVATLLAGQSFDGKLSRNGIVARIKKTRWMLNPWLMPPLACLLTTPELGALLHDNNVLGSWATWDYFYAGFLQHVLPYLEDGEVEALKKAVRPKLPPATWGLKDPRGFHELVNPFFLAACLGMHDELLKVVESWPDDFFTTATVCEFYQLPQYVVFGLGSARWVEQHMRRLQLRLKTPTQFRAWLAHTEFSALDYIRDPILAIGKKEYAEELLQVFTLVKAPEAAESMLLLSRASKGPRPARRWLDEEMGNAIAGLIPTAAGRGQIAEAALQYLREKKRQGFAPVIEECLKKQPTAVGQEVRAAVLDSREKVYTPLDDAATPRPLRAALKEAASLPPLKGSDWVAADRLPPLTLEDRRFNPDQVRTVLLTLQNSALTQPHLLVAELKKHADPGSLDAFAWALFEQWLGEGGPIKQKWAVQALGLLGGDACALKLAPLVRAWPGESQHARAVLGLECLRAIGSDTALLHLHHLSQTARSRGLRARVLEVLEAVARDRGLSPARLEDRLVSDCGLDEQGGRVLDYGPRRFRVILGPEMNPVVRDEAGRLWEDLPRPVKGDDAVLVEKARAEWKQFREQVQQVVSTQAVRLEQAMIARRRWGVEEFETLLVRHPLMGQLVRLLLWGGYDDGGNLVSPFRVSEEGPYVDVHDAPCRLEGVHTVGIVHPLELPDRLRTAWGGQFGDYEIHALFPQLGRPIATPEEGEESAREISRFQAVQVPGAALMRNLNRLGWVRGYPDEMGRYSFHSRTFPGVEVTAVVQYEPGLDEGSAARWQEQRLTRCFFLPGVLAPDSSFDRGKAVALGEVDPIVVSEVLSDLIAVTARGR